MLCRTPAQRPQMAALAVPATQSTTECVQACDWIWLLKGDKAQTQPAPAQKQVSIHSRIVISVASHSSYQVPNHSAVRFEILYAGYACIDFLPQTMICAACMSQPEYPEISVYCRVEKQQGQGREAITEGGLCVPDKVQADPVPGGHGSGAGPKYQSYRHCMEESPAHATSLACSLLCESVYLDCHS